MGLQLSLHVPGTVSSSGMGNVCALGQHQPCECGLGQETFSVVAVVIPKFLVWNLKLVFTGRFQIRI